MKLNDIIGVRAKVFALRGAVLAGKFTILIVIARYLPLTEVGEFGIMNATVALCAVLLGAEFYTFSQRELIGSDKSEYRSILCQQAFSYVPIYLTVLPFLSVIFIFDLLNANAAFYFYSLTVGVHSSQEIIRILIALERQLEAAILLFLRSFAWIVFAVPFLHFAPESRNLEFIYSLWLGGCLLAIIAGLAIIGAATRPTAEGQGIRVEYKWILKGYKVAFQFLVGAIILKCVFTFDKYLVEYFDGQKALGAYALYFSISNSVVIFCEATIFSFGYQKLVRLAAVGKIKEKRAALLELSTYAFIASLVCSSLIYLATPIILRTIENDGYIEYWFMLPILLASSVAYVCSLYGHFGLYSMGWDNAILGANITTFVVFLLLCIPLSAYFGFLAVPTSLLLSFSYLAILKAFLYLWMSSRSAFASGGKTNVPPDTGR